MDNHQQDPQITALNYAFDVPEPTLKNVFEIEFTADSILKWKNSLPTADIGVTAKQVFDTIQQMNLVQIETDERWAILELLRPLIQYIAHGLKKHYLNQPKTLNEKNLMIAKLAQTLQLNTGQGYKIIANQCLSQNPIRKDMLAMSLQRFISLSTDIAVRNCQLYSPFLKTLSQEIHRCYKMASCLKILEYNCLHQANAEYSLEDAYKHFLLFTCLDPYRFQQHEMDSIQNCLDIWAKCCKIIPHSQVPQDPKVPGLYAVNLQEDFPATPLHLLDLKTVTQDNLLILDSAPLREHLAKIIAELEPNEISTRLNHINDAEFIVGLSTLRMIFKDLNAIRERSEVRQPSNVRLDFTVGFSNAHFYLNNEKEFKLDNNKINSVTESHDLPSAFDFSISSTEEVVTDTVKSKIQVYQTNTTNGSENGFCVLWNENVFPSIQSADLVSFRMRLNKPLHDDVHVEEPWRLGVLKWIKHNESGLLKLGFEKIGMASPVGVQILKDNKPVGYYLKAFLMQQKEKNFLITTTIPFKTGHKVDCMTQSQDFHCELELLDVVYGTAKFKIFKVNKMIKTDTLDLHRRLVINQSNLNPVQDETIKKPDEFEDLWANL